MSDEKKIVYEELQEGSFFANAIEMVNDSKKIINGIDVDSSRLAGGTAIQAFIGHTDLLGKCTANTGKEGTYEKYNFNALFSNTSALLNTMGVTFSDIDKELAEKIEKG